MLDFLQQLFQQRGSRRPLAAGWQPAADPTPAQARRHAAWVAGRVYRNFLGGYFHAYHALKGGLGNHRGPRVELLPNREAGDNRQGALFFFDPATGRANFEHLYWHLAARVAELGYHRGCHDARQREREGLREHLVKQLFKPNPTNCPQSQRCNQRYGLLHLDLVYLNEEPLFIRLSANPVREGECHFTTPQPFTTLLQQLFDEPAASDAEKALARKFR